MNTLNSFFYFSEDDKKWNVFRENDNKEKVWVQQEDEPKEEMEEMKKGLLEKLRQ